MTDLPVVAYKGFNSDLTCRGFQYTEGETYEQQRPAELCSTGFHACLEPLDVLAYYHHADGAVYHQVELGGDAKRSEGGGDSKVASKKIKIGAKIDIFGMVKVHFRAVWDRVNTAKAEAEDRARKALQAGAEGATSGDRSTAATSGYQSTAATSGDQSTAATSGDESTAATSGYRSTAATSGYRSTAATSGDRSTAATSGYQSTAATSGYRSTAATSGDESTAATSGYRSTAATSGYRSTAATSGDESTAATSGDQSTAATSGYQSTVKVTGAESIAVAGGYGCRASGADGCWLVLAERDDEGHILGVKSVRVGGKSGGLRIKPGALYTLIDGKVTEVKP